MQYRQVGSAGLTVSAIGLGCNNFGSRTDEAGSLRVIESALDAGINFFDTADRYSGTESERILGKALTGQRDRAVIATKFGLQLPGSPSGELRASRGYIIKACEASLRRLNTDYIDLYYLHKPDGHTPIDETLGAIDQLIRDGKVRYAASSNLAAWQLFDADYAAAGHGHHRFIATQAEWNLLARGIENDIVPACNHLGIGVIPFYPLASGLLTGKYRRGAPAPAGSRLASSQDDTGVLTDENLRKVDLLTAFAEERGYSVLQVAVSWLLHQPSVPSVITGATRIEQITQNVTALDCRLNDEDLIRIDALLA